MREHQEIFIIPSTGTLTITNPGKGTRLSYNLTFDVPGANNQVSEDSEEDHSKKDEKEFLESMVNVSNTENLVGFGKGLLTWYVPHQIREELFKHTGPGYKIR